MFWGVFVGARSAGSFYFSFVRLALWIHLFQYSFQIYSKFPAEKLHTYVIISLKCRVGVFLFCLVLSQCHRMFKHLPAAPLPTHLGLENPSGPSVGQQTRVFLCKDGYLIRRFFTVTVRIGSACASWISLLVIILPVNTSHSKVSPHPAPWRDPCLGEHF